MKAGTRREAWKIARMILPYDIEDAEDKSESENCAVYRGVDIRGESFQIRDYGDKLILSPKNGADVTIYIVNESQPIPEKGLKCTSVLIYQKNGRISTYPGELNPTVNFDAAENATFCAVETEGGIIVQHRLDQVELIAIHF